MDRRNFDFVRNTRIQKLRFVNVEQGMTQWWERSPLTILAQIQIPASIPYVGWVCCLFSPLLRKVFLRVLRFSPLLKKINIPKFQFDQELGRRRTTLWMCYLQIIIYYLFIYVTYPY